MVAKEDYDGAAVLKAKMVGGKGIAGVPRDKQETTTTIAALLQPNTVLRTLVRLEKVRLLSIGKMSSGNGAGKDHWLLQYNERLHNKI